MSDLMKKLRYNEQGFHLGADGMAWSPDLSLFGQAADEIERLQATIQEQALQYLSLDGQAEALRERAERAEAERDAVKADAERYRWLRANDEYEWGICRWVEEEWGTGRWAFSDPAIVDSAIDAARSET